jgi:hypothetical protein
MHKIAHTRCGANWCDTVTQGKTPQCNICFDELEPREPTAEERTTHAGKPTRFFEPRMKTDGADPRKKRHEPVVPAYHGGMCVQTPFDPAHYNLPAGPHPCVYTCKACVNDWMRKSPAQEYVCPVCKTPATNLQIRNRAAEIEAVLAAKIDPALENPVPIVESPAAYYADKIDVFGILRKIQTHAATTTLDGAAAALTFFRGSGVVRVGSVAYQVCTVIPNLIT